MCLSCYACRSVLLVTSEIVAHSETYQYYTLPFCTPSNGKEKDMPLEYKTEGLGEVLEGDRLVNTPYNIQFRVDKSDEVLCSRELNAADLQKLRNAVARDYYFQVCFPPSMQLRGRSLELLASYLQTLGSTGVTWCPCQVVRFSLPLQQKVLCTATHTPHTHTHKCTTHTHKLKRTQVHMHRHTVHTCMNAQTDGCLGEEVHGAGGRKGCGESDRKGTAGNTPREG